MTPLKRQMGEKAHNRTISISTYKSNKNGVIVEGTLTDNRLLPTYHVGGEKHPPEIIHHMIIRLLVEDFIVKEVEVEMPGVPRDECLETIDSLEKIKGMPIAKGFTMKIKEMFGAGRGCSHLAELLIAIAPATVQGFWSAFASNPLPENYSTTPMETFLVDTCWVWRRGGPALKKLARQLNKSL